MNNDQLIWLASLVVETKYQTRVSMNEDAIADYANAIMQKGGWPFPPIKVVRQVLVDGFHRIAAARQVIAAQDTPADLRRALQNIPCERIAVDPANNDISDLALQHALAANHTHGLRRSNADKRRAVELALDRWPDKSDREIAKLTQTSHTFVGIVRGELQVATLPLESETESAPDYPLEVETLPPIASLELVIKKLKLGEGLVKDHFDAQGELVGRTVISFLNFKDPFKRYQICDWNCQIIAFSQWGGVGRLLWVLNQLRPDLVAADFDHDSDVRELMECMYKNWERVPPNESLEDINKQSNVFTSE